MSQEIVRCPYCVLGSEFRPMIRRTKKRFACVSCGHAALPDDPHAPYAKCPCAGCQRTNQIATRCRLAIDSRKHLDVALYLPI